MLTDDGDRLGGSEVVTLTNEGASASLNADGLGKAIAIDLIVRAASDRREGSTTRFI
jgi:hypothetical protein